MINTYWRSIFTAHYTKIGLTAVLFIGLLVRIYGIDYGLPYLYGVDEPIFVKTAVRILNNHDLNPHWFAHPGTTTIYMLSMLFVFIYLVGLSLGIFANTGDLAALYFQDPTIFYLSGRIMFAIFGVATILLTYMIASRIFNRSTGLIAATFLSLSPLHVQFSKLIRTDILMTFFILVVFWFCLDILRRRAWSSYMLAGFFTGLAVTTKYPAVVVVMIIIMAHILSKKWQVTDLPKLIVSGVTSLFGAFMSSPFLFLDFRTTLSNVAREANPMRIGATGEGFIQDLAWYIQVPLLDALSIGGLILGGVGIFLCMTLRQKDKWLLIMFPVIFLLFIASLPLTRDRWIIPIIPFTCMIAAHALYRIVMWIGEHWNTKTVPWVGLILLLGIVIPLLKSDILKGREMSGTDTRTIAREWMLDNIPAGSRMLVEGYTPQLPKEQYEFFRVKDDGILSEVDANKIKYASFYPGTPRTGFLKDIGSIRKQNIEYMVISNYYDRYLSDSKKYAEYAKIVAKYETLMKMGVKIYEVKRVPGKNGGPTIQVYRFNGSSN